MNRDAAGSTTAGADHPHLRRDLRAMVGDGAAFSVMVGLGETYFAAFALAAGLGDALAGWLATLPMLAGGLLQLATPYMVVQLRSCRRWVVLCAGLQAATFVPLIASALHGGVPAALLFLCAALYWGFGLATNPAWNVWAETLVPARRRARYFARRSRVCQAALVLSIVGGGLALQAGARERSDLTIFALLFAAAATARGLSTLCLSAQSEPAELVHGLEAHPPWRAWRSVRNTDAERLLLYLLALQVGVHVAAPFFTPYMLNTLALSYVEYTVLTASAFGARILVLPLLGRLAHARGNRAVLWLGAVGVCPLPALWLVSSSFPYLLALQLLSGAAWAAFELSTLLSFFEDFPPRERPSVLTAYNLANGVAMSVGALLGGYLLRELGALPATYAALFLASTAARTASLLLLRRMPLPQIPLEAAPLRTLAVRPSQGAFERPILGTLPDEGDSDPVADLRR